MMRQSCPHKHVSFRLQHIIYLELGMLTCYSGYHHFRDFSIALLQNPIQQLDGLATVMVRERFEGILTR
jgi:hypothetical protein